MTTKPTPGPDGAAVRLTGLHRRFGPVHAVRGVDLLIVPGEVVAFLGPNGAGKSTTIDILLGLTRPDAGSVRLFGTDPVTAVQSGRVGAMLQAGALLPDVTVKELVTMFAGLHRHPMPVNEAMELAGITDIAGRRTQKLSGGQAQRVRFTLALVPDRELQQTREALAVAAERERIGRDLHDILGHSLTAIAVKAGLARRLVGRDDAAAATEIGEVERLAREALADVRATASGFREVSLATELAVAGSMLRAAGVSAPGRSRSSTTAAATPRHPATGCRVWPSGAAG
jgi:ABC-type nitrate/sulfonate/bicarbonate transport system ATPase subunit